MGDGRRAGRCGGFSFLIMILLNSQVSATYKSAGTDLGGGVSINVCPSVVETQLLVFPTSCLPNTKYAYVCFQKIEIDFHVGIVLHSMTKSCLFEVLFLR